MLLFSVSVIDVPAGMYSECIVIRFRVKGADEWVSHLGHMIVAISVK